MSADDIKELVRHVAETEYNYLLHGERHDPITTPWMPYQPADFIGIVWECMPELKGCKFLDVGCGPGTKMQIARDLFGLNVAGIEIDGSMAFDASKFLARGDADIEQADALTVHGSFYAGYDLIWLYRPFRDRDREANLEQLIITNMMPGGILAGGSWETDVSALGWMPIVDDCLHSPDGKSQIIRGAWRKPKARPA